MKVQQDVADLVIKGDETLEALFPPKDEQPEWATFDEDEDHSADAGAGAGERTERMTEGRFALYSVGDANGKGNGHGLGLGDVNGDGRPDILCKDGYW